MEVRTATSGCNLHVHIYIYGNPPPSYLPFLGEVKEVFRVQG